MNKFYNSNVKLWDELSLVHYDLKNKIGMSDNKKLMDIELKELGDVTGKKILHLQCHLGLESIEMASMGAEVTGVDYSENAIRKARLMAQEFGVHVNFVCTSVEDMLGVANEYYDIVFASCGTIMWIQDLNVWARQIALKLKRDGVFILIDEHPFAAALKSDGDRLFVGYKYKTDPSKPYITINEKSYIQEADVSLSNIKQMKWGHGVSGVLMNLLQNAIRIDKICEFKKTFYKMFDDMKCNSDGWWELDNNEFNVPLMFVVRGSKK